MLFLLTYDTGELGSIYPARIYKEYFKLEEKQESSQTEVYKLFCFVDLVLHPSWEL